jgi:hypothetical protein
VSLADLKARMGHDSTRAALIYQHATAPAGMAIADALDKQITASQPAADDDSDGEDGQAGALAPVG